MYLSLRFSSPPVVHSFFLQDAATTEIYTLFPTRRSSDLGRGMPRARRHARDDRERAQPRGRRRHRRRGRLARRAGRSEEHTSELQSPDHLVCRLLLEKKKNTIAHHL